MSSLCLFYRFMGLLYNIDFDHLCLGSKKAILGT